MLTSFHCWDKTSGEILDIVFFYWQKRHLVKFKPMSLKMTLWCIRIYTL